MNKKLIINGLKLLVTAAILLFVGLSVKNTLAGIQSTEASKPIAFDWRFAPLGVAGFVGVMLTSSSVWLWLGRRLGNRSPVLPLIGAYCYSQMGKYIPGKVVLLFMRIARAKRFGMDEKTTTISTLIENAMYMVSGALTAILTVAFFRKGALADAAGHLGLLVSGAVALVGICIVLHPRVLYPLLNAMMKRFKLGGEDLSHRIRTWQMALSVLLFTPCWFFGGIGLWASMRCVAPVSMADGILLPGAFALSVIVGMASLLPGGAVIREAVQVFFLVPILTPILGDNAAAAAAIAVGIQRLCQIVAELLLGFFGAWVTARKPAAMENSTPVTPGA